MNIEAYDFKYYCPWDTCICIAYLVISTSIFVSVSNFVSYNHDKMLIRCQRMFYLHGWYIYSWKASTSDRTLSWAIVEIVSFILYLLLLLHQRSLAHTDLTLRKFSLEESVSRWRRGQKKRGKEKKSNLFDFEERASLERGSQKFELTDLFRFCFQLFCKCCRYLGSKTNIWNEVRERVKPDSLAHVVERVTRPRARWRPTSSMIAANRRVSSVLIVAS